MTDTTVDNTQIVPYEKRKGLSICIISRGQMPSIWTQHLTEKITKRIPSGMYWNYIWQIGSPETTGDNYASLRNKCIVEALKRGSKWVFFIDDDVFVPETVIGKMIEHSQKGLKIISGLYHKKTTEVEPVIFKSLGDGPYYNYPINEIFEIEGSGAGCLWIDTSVFDEFRKNNIPYFKQDWLMQLDQGNGKKSGIHVEIGEDHWLFYQAKKLGIPAYCDSRLLCDHFCSRQNKMFPLSDEVYRIRGKDLNSKENVVPAMNEFLNNGKKNILFVAPTSVELNGNSIKEKPIGGSETALIQTAKRLAKNHNVSVLSNVDKEGIYDEVIYMPLNKMDFFNKREQDIVIMVRNHTMLIDPEFKKRIKAKEYWLWMQDYPMYPGFENFLQTLGVIDKYICVSNDHKQALLTRFPCQLDDEKIIVIENGVDKELFKDKKIERKKNQFYHPCTPFRGLEQLVEIFPRIKEKVPDATLKVCSGLRVYNDPSRDMQFKELYKKCKETEGIEYIGNVKQDELAKIALESYAMLYPCTFAETNCISVEESQTAGTPVICNDLGAIKETVHKDCGIIIPGNPKMKEWQNKFVEAVIDLCKNKKKWSKLHNKCLKQNFDWNVSVKKWNKEIENVKTEYTGEPSTIITPL